MSAIQRFGDELKTQLQNKLTSVFAVEPTSPPRKTVRASEASTGQSVVVDNKRSASPPTRQPFPKEQSAWLQNALSDVLGVFGEHVDQRLTAVEAKVETITESSNLQGQEISTLQREVKELKEELKAVKGARDTAGSANASSSAQGVPTVSFSGRTHAVIGRLGWDNDELTIEERAKQLLREAQIDSSTHTAPCATRRQGSMAEVHFNTPDDLARAKTSVRLLRKKFDRQEHPAWMDVKQTPAAPARMTNRIADFITNVESQKQTPATITKGTNPRAVKRNGQIIGRPAFGRWKWEPEGCENYDETTRQHAVEWAMQE